MYECHLIDDITEWRNDLTELLATFAVGLEVPHGPEPRPEAVLKRFDMLAKLSGLAVLLDKFGLEIEQIDVTRGPRHEELNDPLGLGLVMQPAIGTLWRVRKRSIRAKQRRKGEATQPATRLEEEISAIHVISL